MASIIGRAAFRASRPLRASGVNSGAESAASAASREADKNALKQGARKDPELYVWPPYSIALCKHSVNMPNPNPSVNARNWLRKHLYKTRTNDETNQ